MAIVKILYQLARLVIAFFNRSARASGWAHLPANAEPNRKVEVPAEGLVEAQEAHPTEAIPAEPSAATASAEPPPLAASVEPSTAVTIKPSDPLSSATTFEYEDPDFESKIIDRRKDASPKHVYGRRAWDRVTGVCLHQTACVLGENPPRWDTVGCHVGVTRSGKVIWLHDFNKLVVHGNRWNAQTVGIEIDGMYEGVEGDIRTFWRPKDQPNLQPQRPTEVQLRAVRDLIRWIKKQVIKNGGKLNALVAHRQASVNRRNDPGSRIWKDVALPMSKELDLSDGGPGFKLGDGYPIPEEWDPRRKGYRY
jgi:hypothetical protein